MILVNFYVQCGEIMDIHGLQKMTLLDFPGHVACTVFLAGCNFKCPYCHNSELIDKGADILMDDKELLSFLKKRVGLLDGVAFTGGEPLLSEGLEDLIIKVRELGYKIKLDTNGSFPKKLQSLLDKNLLDYVAMDIKNSEERYAQTVGVNCIDIDKVKKSISILMSSNIDYEFRTTVVDELFDEESFIGISKLIKGAKRYFLQEFTDRDTVVYEGFSAPSKEKMEKYLDIIKESIESAQIRGVE